MSFNVLIGSDDLPKIKDTIELLKFIQTLVEDKSYFQTEQKTYTNEELTDLTDWYSSLYNLISVSGNEEDIELDPLSV
jgi:hypothetical protein